MGGVGACVIFVTSDCYLKRYNNMYNILYVTMATLFNLGRSIKWLLW